MFLREFFPVVERAPTPMTVGVIALSRLAQSATAPHFAVMSGPLDVIIFHEQLHGPLEFASCPNRCSARIRQLCQQGITNLHRRKSRKVPVGGPQLANPMKAADRRNARIVDRSALHAC